MTSIDEISEEVGGTENVLGFLESHWVEGHVDSRLRIRPDNGGSIEHLWELEQDGMSEISTVIVDPWSKVIIS